MRKFTKPACAAFAGIPFLPAVAASEAKRSATSERGFTFWRFVLSKSATGRLTSFPTHAMNPSGGGIASDASPPVIKAAGLSETWVAVNPPQRAAEETGMLTNPGNELRELCRATISGK